MMEVVVLTESQKHSKESEALDLQGKVPAPWAMKTQKKKEMIRRQ